MLHTPKIFDTAIYIGFLIFVLSLPFGYSTVFLNVAMSLVFVGWIGRMIAERKLGWHYTALDIAFALFLGLALVASFFAPHPATSSLGYFWKWLRAVLLFYAVIHSCLGHRWRHVVVAFIFAGGISCALGLWYYANDERLAMDFMGQMPLAYQEELQRDQEVSPTGSNRDQEVSPTELHRDREVSPTEGQRERRESAHHISEKLRIELRKHNIPLSPSAAFAPAKVADEWRIEDAARERRYVIRKSEARLMVYMIEPRLTGTFKMPNDLGAYLALLIPFTFGYFVASLRAPLSQSLWVRFALCAVLVLMCANLALTLTRAAWVSVAVATTCIGAYYVVDVLFRRRAFQARRLVFLAIFPVAVLCLSLFFMPRHIKARFQTLLEHPAGFMGERPQWWQTSVELIRQYPFTGIGLGRFRYEYQLNGPPEQYNVPYHAHNIYLHIAVEHGIPALLVFAWLLVMIWRQLFVLRKADDFWGMGLFIGGSGFLISALVYGLADNVLHHRSLLIFWFIVGLVFLTSGRRGVKARLPDRDAIPKNSQ